MALQGYSRRASPGLGGAIAAGFGPAIVDPGDFNLQHPALMLKTAAMGALLAGIISMAEFLERTTAARRQGSYRHHEDDILREWAFDGDRVPPGKAPGAYAPKGPRVTDGAR